MADERCRHPGCQCKIAPGKQFCSPHCADTGAGRGSGAGCGCGHAECHG